MVEHGKATSRTWEEFIDRLRRKRIHICISFRIGMTYSNQPLSIKKSSSKGKRCSINSR